MIETSAQDSTWHSSSAARIRVFQTEPQSDGRWEAFVNSHPNGTIYHHPAWINVIQREYGQSGEHLACEDEGGRLLAVLPMFHTKGLPSNLGGRLTGRRLSSLPRTPLAGPLSKNRDATVAILREAVSRALLNPRISLQIKTLGPDLDGLVDGIVSIPWRHSYVLELPHGPKASFRVPDARERAKIRWAVNKAAKLGLSVRSAQTEADLQAWYRLYLETMRRSAVPPRAYRFFADLWKSLRPRGMMDLLLAELANIEPKVIIAGSVFLHFGSTVWYAFSGMTRKHSSFRANDAIQWRAINEACERGYRYFDFGEVPHGHTELARFKSKWGAQPVQLHRYYAPPPCSVNELYEAPSRSLAQSLWCRLPLKVTAWLGDHVYSYL